MVIVKDNILYEGVLSTLFNNKPYLAPVGFIKNNNLVKMKIYKNTFLHRVLSEASYVVINITYDPLPYFLFCFKEEIGRIEYSNYVFFDNEGIPRLIKAYGYVDLVFLEKEDHIEYTLFKYNVVKIHNNKHYIDMVEPYTRCYSSIIEALIYLSKIKYLIKTDPDKVTTLLEGFTKSLEIAKKTCIDSQYIDLISRIDMVAKKWLGNY